MPSNLLICQTEVPNILPALRKVSAHSRPPSICPINQFIISMAKGNLLSKWKLDLSQPKGKSSNIAHSTFDPSM